MASALCYFRATDLSSSEVNGRPAFKA